MILLLLLMICHHLRAMQKMLAEWKKLIKGICLTLHPPVRISCEIERIIFLPALFFSTSAFPNVHFLGMFSQVLLSRFRFFLFCHTGLKSIVYRTTLLCSSCNYCIVVE